MKKLLLLSALFLFFNYAYAQDDEFDRTNFKGSVTSQVKVILNEMAGTEKESEVETIFTFDSKTIKIDEEVYSIVNKEFDGIDLNTFLCTKRGSNYTINYIVDDFISVVDSSNPNIETHYKELSE